MKTVTLTIGAALSGKTTFCEQWKEHFNYVYLSSDKFRAVVGGSESNLECSAQVFKVLEYNLEYFLKYGHQNILIDCTNRTPKSRRNFVNIVKKYGARLEAVCFDVPLADLLKRNKIRERKLPQDVIQSQFEGLVWPTFEEGFEEIIFNKQ